MKLAYEKELLQKLVTESFSLREVLLKLNKSLSGTAYATIKKYIDSYKIDCTHFLTKRKKFGTKIPTSELLSVNDHCRGTVRKRILDEKLIEYKCKFCGNNGEWLGKKLALRLDHINGINTDNQLQNLRFICPNCDATLETYCKGFKGLKPKLLKKNRRSNPRLGARKVKDRPTKKMLLELLKTKSYVEVGKMYNVSDNAIRKWIKCETKWDVNSEVE